MIFNFVYIVEAGPRGISAGRVFTPPYCRNPKTH